MISLHSSQHPLNGQQPGPNKLRNSLLPITLRPAPVASQTSLLPLLRDGYMAFYAVLDAVILWRVTSYGGWLRGPNTLSELECYLAGSVAV